MNQNSYKIELLVLGLGNELLTDDGIGVHVVRKLQKEPPVDGMFIAEVGTGILHAQDMLEQAQQVIAIDAVHAGGKSGTIYRFNAEDAQVNRAVTLHELGIVGLLQFIPEHRRPQITIIGIEPETLDYGMELSPNVESVVPQVIEIIKELGKSILSCKQLYHE